MIIKIIGCCKWYPQQPYQAETFQQAAQPAQLVPVAVAAGKLLLPVKACYKPKSKVNIKDDRNKRQQLQYRVQLPKGRGLVCSRAGFYAFYNFYCLGAQLQQHRTKMQHIPAPEF